MKIVTKLLSLCLALVLFVTTLIPSAAMASPSLDQEQQVFLLSILSNAASSRKCQDTKGCQEELQELLKTDITNYLNTPSIQQDIGNWDLVWGPVVYQVSLTKKAANAMYVAQNGNQYVVAIAGTNPISFYDWLIEDGSVKRQVSWPYGDIPPNLEPKISQGTSIGLNNLLQKMKSSGQSLLEFLGETVENSDDEIEIIFTGHSLGGALSPTLALAAFDQKSEWAGEKPFKISVYPSAGPTPGNQDFSTYYDSELGNSTTRIWNDIDIVPHAWNETMLSEIPSLYQPEIQPGWLVKGFVGIAEGLAEYGNYTQILPGMLGLEGMVNPSTPSLCKTPGSSNSIFLADEELSQVIEELEDKILKDPELQRYLSNGVENSSSLNFEQKQLLKLFVSKFSTFMKQAGYQHTSEYAVLLDVKDPYCTMFAETQGELFAPPDSSEFEALVLRLLKEQPQLLKE
ncbi:MAG: lipase family protein [Okeania sp. SIO2D1]|nr:lipase family protein [Okeania sp. SIO2D1]